MFKTLFMIIAGFVVGLILSENAQIIRHSVPRGEHLSGNINQFIFILGIGNSSNTFEINTDSDTITGEEDNE